jgi:MFS family permease
MNQKNQLYRFMLGFGLGAIPGALLAPFLTLRLAERGLEAGWIGIFATIPSFTYIIALLTLPMLFRRFGEQALFRMALLACTLTTIGFLLTEQLIVWIVLSAISGWAAGVRYTIAEIWIPALTTASDRGRTMAWFQTFIGTAFFIGTGLLLIIGTQSPALLLAATLPSLVGLMLLWQVAPGSSAAPGTPAPLPGGMIQVTGIAVLMASLLGGLLEAGITTIIPLYGLSVGFDATMATWVVVAVGLGSLVQYPFGALADRLPWHHVTIGSILLIVASALLLPLTPSLPWLLFGLGFVWGSAGGGLYTLAIIRNGMRLHGAQLTGASTVTQFAYMIGSTVGPAISGVALDLTPQYGLAILIGVTGIIGLGVIGWGSELRPCPKELLGSRQA